MIINRPFFILFFFFLFTYFLTLPNIAKGENNPQVKQGTIKSASEFDYPPFSIVRSDGYADGFSVELLKATVQAIGREISFTVGPWHKIKQQLIDGHFDVLPLVSYSVERDIVLDFSTPYLRMHGAIFVRKGETTIQTEADLKEKEVLVLNGDTAHEYAIRKKLSNNLILKESYEDAMLALSSGKHDAVLVQQLVGFQLIKKLKISNIVDVNSYTEMSLKPTAKPLSGFEQKFCFAVPEGNKELLSLLNEGLSLIIADGTFNQLYQKWFGPILPVSPVPLSTVVTYLVYSLTPILFFLSIFCVWYLKKEVKRKTSYLEKEIKKRELTKEALQASEEKFRKMFEQAPLSYQSLDVNGNFIEVNATWLSVLGYQKHQVIGKNFSEFLHPDWKEHFKDNFPRFKAVGEVLGVEFEMLKKDGSSILVSFHGKIAKGLNNSFQQTHCIFQDITLSRKSQEESEKNKTILLEAEKLAGLGGWEWDIENDIWSVSKNWQTIHGCSNSYMSTSELIKLAHPDDILKIQTVFESVIDEGGVYEVEHRIVNQTTGEIKYIHAYGEAHLDETGKAVKMFGAAQDITERKLTEENIRKSEHRYGTILKTAGDGFWITDINGHLVEVNDAYSKMSGYSQEELLTMQVSDLEATEWPEHMNKGMESGYDRFETVHRRKDGSLYQVEVNFSYSGIDGGRFVAFVKDISIQKQIEKSSLQLKERLESLWNITKVADSDLKTISDHVLAEVQNMTQSKYAFYGFLDENENIMDLHSWSKETMSDCETDNKTLHFPVDKAGIWAEAIKEKKLLTINNFHLDHPGKKGLPGGHVPINRLMAVPLVKENKVISIVAIANKTNDYSEQDEKQVLAFMRNVQILIDRKNAEQNKLELESQLRQLQKNEAIGALAGGIAHDFNNILFPIVGFTEMLKDDLDENSDLHENVDIILAGALRATDLVSQILTFSRQVEEKSQPLKPHYIINEVTKLMRATTPTSIEIKKSIDPNTFLIMADPTQIHQVAMNLITNANYAMRENGGTLTIRLQNIEGTDIPDRHLELGDGPHVLLSIGDTGSGMTDITLEKIFNPYFTSKPKGEGTGLGLSVVYGIIKNYGGDISVISTIGQGTLFNIYIPALIKEKAEKQVQASAAITGGDERILLVDDETQVLRIEQMILERLGYTVELCDSSLNALEKINANPDAYDLVISDMTMPNMTGDILTQKILNIKPTMPIVICTGFSERISLENVIAIGGKALLMKPIIKSKLAITVRDTLDKANKDHKNN